VNGGITGSITADAKIFSAFHIVSLFIVLAQTECCYARWELLFESERRIYGV